MGADDLAGRLSQPSPNSVADDSPADHPADRQSDANRAGFVGRRFIGAASPHLKDETGSRPLPPFPGDALKIAPPLQA